MGHLRVLRQRVEEVRRQQRLRVHDARAPLGSRETGRGLDSTDSLVRGDAALWEGLRRRKETAGGDVGSLRPLMPSSSGVLSCLTTANPVFLAFYCYFFLKKREIINYWEERR